MAAEVLIFLTYIAVLLLIGLLSSIISNKIKIPNILLLILVGIGLSNVSYKNAPLISFPNIFLTAIGILALVMIVFDASSRFKMREFDRLSFRAFSLSLIFLVLSMIVLTIASIIIFDIKSVFLALIFASLMAGTDPAALLYMLKNSTSKVFVVLKLESLLNTPLIVLVPFIIVDIMMSVKNQFIVDRFIEQAIPLLKQFVVGIGAGILVGIVMLKFMRKQYSKLLSPLAVITAALLTYIIAENLEGNGVLAVTAMGLLFGNIYLKQKFQLREFSSIFSNSLEILVFILIGMIITIPFTTAFLVKSFILFVIYILVRYLAILIVYVKQFNFKERLFMSLNVQKGIAVAVVAFSLANLNIAGLETILNLILAFILYSIILSTIVLKLSKLFLKVEG